MSFRVRSQFQSPPTPKGWCFGLVVHLQRVELVSILTGPIGPVLPFRVGDRPNVQDVSTLIGPGGPLLRKQFNVEEVGGTFHPSPALKGHCFIRRRGAVVRSAVPTPTDSRGPVLRGCRADAQLGAVVSTLTGSSGPVQRSPCRRSGCRCAAGFKPYRPRRAGAAGPGEAARDLHRPISILTPQKGRCKARRPVRAGGAFGFNPHRPQRTDASWT